jgi:glutamate carboxypeptidase
MKQLLAFCESEHGWLRETIEGLVRLESPTLDRAAVDRCGASLARRLTDIGGRVREVASGTAGRHLVADFDGEGPRVLLLGHFDTVWPIGQLAAMPLVEREGKLFGPGVFDMKAGIAIGMLAIRALRGGPEAPRICFLLTSDEETGSGTSRSIIEQEARHAEAVLVLEPSLPGGVLKTARKGCGQFVLDVSGVAAHAGIEPEKGANAILELCDRLLEIDRVQNPEAGTTLTACLAAGGTRANVVPARATATIDARVASAAEADRVSRLMALMRGHRPGTDVKVTGGFDRPPFERTPAVVRLLELARVAGGELGLEVSEGTTGGASDGNITASLGVPTLDGLGAVGDGAHAGHEHVLLAALPGRAALVAGLMILIARGSDRNRGRRSATCGDEGRQPQAMG